jgi:tetratricopeptide (TPR) repeat protein
MPNEQAAELFRLAIEAEEAGDQGQARDLYEAALALDPKAPHTRLRLGSLLNDLGKWNETIRIVRPLAKRSHLAACLIARSYAQLRRWGLAERFYRQSLVIKDSPVTWVLLGEVLDRRGRHAEAVACLRKALKIDPDYEEAHYNLGYWYRSKGKLTLAEKHLKRAIEIDPRYARAYGELGQLVSQQKSRTKEAVRLLQKAVTYNPEDHWSRAYLANGLWALRKLKAAKEQYLRLIEHWPDSPLPYRWYGDFLAQESKDRGKAEPYFQLASEIARANS